MGGSGDDAGRSVFKGAVLCVVIRYLLWGHAERDGSHVYHFVALHAWEAEMET